MTTTAGTRIEELDCPSEVLVFARERRAAANAAEADVLVAAALWAEQHPPESIHPAATWTTGGETGLPLAGQGAPLVAEFCIAELAVALGMSSDAGRALLADAVELKHRLRRTWGRVQAHQLPAWRARRVAQATLGLSIEAARFVDTHVAPYAHRIGPAALDRLVAEAIARFMPDQALAEAHRAADGRHLRVHHDHVTFTGTSYLEGELDLADALDLDAALTRGAESLKAAGCTESLEVRRSMAAGDLARRQLALDLQAGDTPAPGGRPAPPARQVVLYVHLAQAAITGTSTSTSTSSSLDLARVENHHQGVTADQVRTWCANPETTVTITPVIDLAEQIAVGAYEIPDRIREHTGLRDHTCVFPWCTRPARTTDRDHIIAWPRGSTTTDNIAPLCRRHHRLKTHTTWTYTALDPGSYLWSSPHGYQFLRNHTGTRDVTTT